MPVRLFIANLPYNVTEAELREFFSVVGQFSYLSLPTDRETGRPRGFAFLEFNDRAQAEEAIRRFNNQLFKGRPLAVSEARARENRPSVSPPNRYSRPPVSSSIEPSADASPAPESKRGRNFGPDAAPRSHRNKGKSGSRSERAPKGPMRETVRGQFFGADDDDDDFNEEESPKDYFEDLQDNVESEEKN